MNDEALYRPSGKSGRGIIALPLGILAAAVLSIVYGYVTVYNPFVGYLSFLIPLAYGAAVGIVLCWVGTAAKCRNVALASTIGMVCGAAALYFGWAAFIYVFVQRFSPGKATLLGTYFDPVFIWSVANRINVTGWFSIKKSTPTGIVLWIFWAGEALIILWTTSYIGSDWIKQTVFCEGCDRWCKSANDIARFTSTEDAAALEQLKSGDLTPLAKLAPARSHDPVYLRVDSQRCSNCRDTAAVNVSKVTIGKDEKGKETVAVVTLAKLVLMTQDLLDGFQSAAKQAMDGVQKQESAEAATRDARMQTGELREYERREVLRAAFLEVDEALKKRSGFTFDKESTRGCLGSIGLGVAALVIGAALSSTPAGPVILGALSLGSGGLVIYTFYLFHTGAKRHIAREVEPALARKFKALAPTQQELTSALAEAKGLGYAAGKFIDAQRLFTAIQQAESETPPRKLSA